MPPTAIAAAEAVTNDGASQRPRVLHVLGWLTLGGIETWLMHMLRNKELFDVQHELLLTEDEPGTYEAEALRLGIRIHKIPLRSGRFRWFQRFRRLLLEKGPYFAVHSHGDPAFTALVLATARSARVSSRIAHSHSARSRGEDCPLTQKAARLTAVPLVRSVATRCIGISEDALVEIAGRRWRRLQGASILLYGFDFSRFADAHERATKLAARLGLPASSRIVGSVARFFPVKNHRLLIAAFRRCHEEIADAHLVLVGAGPLRAEIEAQVREERLQDVVHFAGTTDDVPAFMALFDLFVLPSYSEGLGIVCVEAQAAGTRMLVSDTVPREAFVVPGAVETLSPTAGESEWGGAMARLLCVPDPAPPEDCLRQVEEGRFGIERCIAQLSAIYRSELGLRRPASSTHELS